MKKIIFIALTAMTAIGLASCNREEIAPPENGVQGKYLLTEITAYTGEDLDTKTSVQANGVVKWSADDQIAVKGTDGVLHYYRLVFGGGTSIGRFLPAAGQSPASYNAPEDLTAVYPACAAELSGGELYVNINNQDLSSTFTQRGVTTWSGDSRFSFSNNDIKVAVPDGAEVDNNGKVNFKFQQLGTYCEFLVDFTQSDIAETLAMESIERIQVTTLEGAAIAGRAKVVGTSLGSISMPQTSLDWTLTTPAPMTAEKKFEFVLYPEVTISNTLKVTITTTDHEFVFTGKPTRNFEGGVKLSFPITVDKNFTLDGTDLAYTRTDRTGLEPFYYYGGTNCLLLAQTNMTGTLDVTQYVTDSYWHNTKNMVDVQTSRPAVYAKIIWSEGAEVIASSTVNGSAYGYKLKLAGSAAGAADAISTDSNGKSTLTIKRGSGSGNALVGIYDSSDRLLWSYHIWCPDEDPTEGMYEYSQTNSGTYIVMTMPIGALKKASAGTADPEAAGNYYQWGRKDPLGRPTNITNTNGGDVRNVYGPDQTTALNIGDAGHGIAGGNLKDCEIWFANSSADASLSQLYNAWDAAGRTKPVGRFMIDYSVTMPWMYIMCNGKYDNCWTELDSNLWGNNKESRSFPFMEETYKSIFDPSPEGFRVAPQDLWVNFTQTHDNANGASLSDKWNVVSTTFNKGFEYYYQDWKSGPTDFYLASGHRRNDSGSLNLVTTYGYTWASGTKFILSFDSAGVRILSTNNPASAFPIRCVQEP
jgi:hypothetical protein